MAMCFSTRASVATVLSPHPGFTIRLWVKQKHKGKTWTLGNTIRQIATNWPGLLIYNTATDHVMAACCLTTTSYKSRHHRPQFVNHENQVCKIHLPNKSFAPFNEEKNDYSHRCIHYLFFRAISKVVIQTTFVTDFFLILYMSPLNQILFGAEEVVSYHSSHWWYISLTPIYIILPQ